MKQAKIKQNVFNKKKELTIFALSAAMSFILLLFSPVIIYMENPSAFMVDFKHIAVVMLVLAVVVTLALDLVLNLLLLISPFLYMLVSRLVFGVLIAFNVQAFLLNGRTEVVRSADVRYYKYRTEILSGAMLFIIIAILPLIITIVVAVFPESRLRKLCSGGFVAAVSVGLLIFNAGIASVKTAETDFICYDGVQNKYISYAPSMSLSGKGNIIVFITDRLDGDWMDEMLVKYPELNSEFSGFTYYRNCVSTGTSTFPTVPQMLTNRKYGGEEWYPYLSKAWSGDTVTSELKANGYNVYLIPDRITTLCSTSQVEDQCDNIAEYEDSYVNLNCFGIKGIGVTMLRLSAARMSPYCIKHYITYWMGANFCRGMIANPDCGDDYLIKQAFPEHDVKYYNYLVNHGITADSANKTFSFIHLSGCHNVYDPIADIHGYSGDNDVYKTTRGDFDILFEYFSQMKKLGIYDNSTIIVMGDHGRVPSELETGNEINSAITTALLIKPAGVKLSRLETDSVSELSLEYFPASILGYAGISSEGFGHSFEDAVNGEADEKRYIRTYDFDGYGRMVYKAAYEVSDNARDFDNWELIKD